MNKLIFFIVLPIFDKEVMESFGLILLVASLLMTDIRVPAHTKRHILMCVNYAISWVFADRC